MPIERGTVVLNLMGRDKGSLAVVLSVSNTAVIIADGKSRPIEHPKHKNRKHVSATEFKLTNADMATNRSLRKALTAFATANQ